MKPEERYVSDVMARVFAADHERQRFADDLRTHFAAAAERGEPVSHTVAELGRPADVAAAFNAEREIRYAGFWQRVVAFLGDIGAMVGLALPLIALVLLFESRGAAAGWPVPWRLLVTVPLGCAAVGIVLFYFPLLEWRFGKTLGKHLLRIRVVHEDGSPVGLGAAFVRRLSMYFEMLVPDALFVPFTDKRQRALDIVAKTIVAREPGAPAEPWRIVLCLLVPVASFLAAMGVAVLLGPP